MSSDRHLSSKESDTAGLRRIADTIEQNGGWHIAALHVRGAADELEALQQFKEWAEPQCQDYAANKLEIERLNALLNRQIEINGDLDKQITDLVLKRRADETTAVAPNIQWTVDEYLSDGRWERHALAHWWASNADAHRQRQDLEKRFPGRLFGVRASEKATVRHAVTCKKFPDPYDERDPVGPCTCGAENGSTAP